MNENAMWLTANQTSDLPMPANCRLIADLTVGFSLSDSIRAWSIWRGYFLALIDQYSPGDPIIIVIFLSTVAFSPLMWAYWRRRFAAPLYRSQEDGLQERVKGFLQV
jgi:hypothetical protein